MHTEGESPGAGDQALGGTASFALNLDRQDFSANIGPLSSNTESEGFAKLRKPCRTKSRFFFESTRERNSSVRTVRVSSVLVDLGQDDELI